MDSEWSISWAKLPELKGINKLEGDKKGVGELDCWGRLASFWSCVLGVASVFSNIIGTI